MAGCGGPQSWVYRASHGNQPHGSAAGVPHRSLPRSERRVIVTQLCRVSSPRNCGTNGRAIEPGQGRHVNLSCTLAIPIPEFDAHTLRRSSPASGVLAAGCLLPINKAGHRLPSSNQQHKMPSKGSRWTTQVSFLKRGRPKESLQALPLRGRRRQDGEPKSPRK